MFLKTVSILKCISETKRFVRSMVPGLLIVLLALGVVSVYTSVIISMVKSEKYGGGYVPFALAGVTAAIAGLVLTIAHIDEDFKDSKQNLVRTGELYALAAAALTAFGLLFPVYDSLEQPSAAYYITFLFVVLTLVAFCGLLCLATYRIVLVLWKKRKALFKDILGK